MSGRSCEVARFWQGELESVCVMRRAAHHANGDEARCEWWVVESDVVAYRFRLIEARSQRATLGERVRLAAVDFASFAASVGVHAFVLLLTVWHGGLMFDGEDARIGLIRDLTTAVDQHALTDTDVSDRDDETHERGEPHAPAEIRTRADAESARARGVLGEEGARHPARRAAGTTGSRAEIPEAAAFGLIGLLRSSDLQGGSEGAPWALPSEPTAFGADDPAGGGFGGLALSGIGEGGGGSGTGVSLGLGDVARGACGGRCGEVSRTEHHERRLAGRHTTRAPSIRCGISVARPEGCSAVVNGRLPPEVIQRVVRANFGRFRACYESGLATNPSLEGRVTLKFVVDSDGAVSTALDGGSDLPDQGVVACAVRAAGSLSFPAPEGGIVTVVYPLIFSTG